MTNHELDLSAIEAKWQKKWDDASLYKAVYEPGRPKFYIHFAYPGISGYLHVGHMRGFTYTDVISRYKRMTGHQVMFPVGTHATGNQAISFASKVKRKDPRWIEYLHANGCPDAVIERLSDTQEVVKFFNDVYVNEYWKKFGFLANWERFTCTIWPDYNKFIQWQFKKLKDLGYLTQKPYFATFCPNCGPVAVDPSETDLQKGGKAEKHEYTLLKFKIGDEFVTAATLRPETVFGQTNFWVDPDVDYSKVRVGKEVWIVSKPCASKLAAQKDDVEEVGTIHGRELVGKTCIAPVVDREIPILPSKFCDQNVGAGMVTSVPSDAPYDYQALLDLKKDKALLERYGLEPQMVEGIEPIAIIDTKGMGDLPAVKIVEEMGVKDQNDPKLVEATRTIYKSGFHQGRMKDICNEYAGLTVEQAKDQVKEDMVAKGDADVLHDLSEEVVCRCGQHVLVKRIDDQWFIRYSDEDWTEKAKGFAEGMNIYPRSYYDNMPGILDWFQDRACARLGNWLGTRFPFDERWIIEPISDSTIYPSYYIVSRYVNEGRIGPDNLTEAFFDYVFLGKGKVEDVASDTGLDISLLNEVRDEFLYWYPVDINLGGKEHQTVHFPVYLMNHVALFPGASWPRGMYVNWWIIQKGGEQKISKSKGGAAPVPDAIKKFTVDALRLYYCHVASPYIDFEWDEKNVFNYKQRLIKIWALINQFFGPSTDAKVQNETKKALPIDRWLLSRVFRNIREAELSMEEFDIKASSHAVFYGLVNDIDWYLKREGEDIWLLHQTFKVLVRAMTPFTPHIAEELWERLGGEGFATTQSFPVPDEKALDLEAELFEDLLRWLMDDVQNIIKVIKRQPGKIILYTAPDWKRKVWTRLAKEGADPDVKALMKEMMASEDLRKHGKQVSKYVPQAVKDLRRINDDYKSLTIDELSFFKSIADFLGKRFECPVEVYSGEDKDAPDPQKKRDKGAPFKPAIALE